jgi:hypothetical protein
MSLTEDIRELSATGEVGVDVITLAKRADGYTDLQIAEAYAEIYHSGEYEFRVDKGMGYFVPKENL